MIDALGRLGLWLDRRRGTGDAANVLAELPAGTGPVLLIASPDPDAHGVRSVAAALTARRGKPQLAILGRDNLPSMADDAASTALLDRLRPDLILVLGDALPALLIEAAAQAEIPLVLADAHIAEEQGSGILRGAMRFAMRRQLLRRFSLLLVADPVSRAAALRQGVPAGRIRVVGPVTETRDPPRATEAERAELATLFQGRHVWLAVSVPEAEEQAIMAAHRAALRYSHRALLILIPDRPDRARGVEERLEADGFTVALRSDEIEPTGEIQILIADDPGEMGLWYRLATVTYLGGTLSGEAQAPRHPFEPASLGSAIIHGPQLAPFADELRQLSGSDATRPVDGEAGLAEAVADLAQPDIVARIAANAWSVSTGGAGVARDIAAPVLALLAKSRRAQSADARPASGTGVDL
ncbi:3-deoxy-D-manno-octulosonic acid transferase [Paracoccus sp. TK19116]|uniref:3-deoxy-D-manno-octulosonic acid transferase n=1 Tax=Paracoccus albicereus TaxID=2922394 RepID=A0ABT1MT36_9RHOB|nr:glycosyltransferase N-terminal domain-containing protein [Paracoccus albicereus]MCQ0971351.1 3-deoxy-D-manno-octulosonic acid transferase [Paracoccus albicereus]